MSLFFSIFVWFLTLIEVTSSVKAVFIPNSQSPSSIEYVIIFILQLPNRIVWFTFGLKKWVKPMKYSIWRSGVWSSRNLDYATILPCNIRCKKGLILGLSLGLVLSLANVDISIGNIGQCTFCAELRTKCKTPSGMEF